MPPTDDPLPLIHRNARIRRLRRGDLAAFQAYRSDPDVARYQGWPAMSDADAEQFLVEMTEIPLFRPGEWHQLAIADVDSDTLLGDMGVYVASDGSEAEVGFTLAKAAQGQGTATCAAEAAIQLLLERTAVSKIVGVTDTRNGPSIRLLKRVGMQQVASRAAVFRGEPCVELVFAVQR